MASIIGRWDWEPSTVARLGGTGSSLMTRGRASHSARSSGEEPGDRLRGSLRVREQHSVLLGGEAVEEHEHGHACPGDVVDGDLVQTALLDQPKRREGDGALDRRSEILQSLRSCSS
ncbi:hypothetical protein [Amycolatopsis rubida]|uniref:hypothetical protein n=1 Tax=Amycolatopsis rubida TaxID=112413 RepID=UPI00142F3657|nr:hypothetical protein [Amycolatopsis rubida]